MPATLNLPWMPQWGTFLQAIDEGTKAGLAAARLRDEQEARRPRLHAGGPLRMLAPAAPGPSPMQSSESVIGPIGMLNPPAVPALKEVGGGLYSIQPGESDPNVLNIKTLIAPKQTTEKGATISVPMYEGDPILSAAAGVQPTRISGSPESILKTLGEKAPAMLKQRGSKVGPPPGTISNGYKFLGGENIKENWVPVDQGVQLSTYGNTFGILPGQNPEMQPGSVYMGEAPTE